MYIENHLGGVSMFILTNYSERFVRLRCCECGNTLFLDSDLFKEITSDHVIIKDNVSVTCDNCGTSQPDSEKYIQLEPQILRTHTPTSSTSKDSLSIEELESALIWD